MALRARRLAGTVFSLASMLAGLAASDAHAADYSLVTGSDYPPYADRDLPDGGLAVHIVRLAFAAAGRSVALEVLPWQRGFAMTRAGKIDGTFPYVASAGRLETMLASTPLFVVESRLWYDPARPVRSLADAAGKRYCAPVGYAVPDPIQEMIDRKGVSVFSPAALANCAMMIAGDHADFIAMDPLIMRAVLHSAHIRLVGSNLVVQRRPLTLMVGKANPKARGLLADFTAGLARIKADGTYDRLLRASSPP